MDEPKDLWMYLAPFWEHLEDRHMSRGVADEILKDIKGNVLVIGAGQGLIVKYLQDKGFTVHGLDIESEMVRFAKERHGIDLTLGDANNLPFENNSYNTVIISSGVVDYNKDNDSIRKIMDEALRVTSNHGTLFVSFYQVHPQLEKIYKKIGVIDKKNIYHNRRLFEIDDHSSSPLKCVSMIMNWTGKSFFPVIAYWTKLGITMPKILKDERKNIHNIFDIAEKKNVDKFMLRKCFPNNIPYRNQNDIEIMMNKFGFLYSDITKHEECIMVKFFKSGFTSVKKESSLSGDLDEKECIMRIDNISKHYKGAERFALDSLSLNIKKGIIFGLLGPNGAGKTTLLSIISGINKPTSGAVHYSDKMNSRDFKKYIGYVPQELALYPRLTGRENLEFFGRLYSGDKPRIKKRIEELLSEVGLLDRGNDLVKNYSVGMMRRLNLAIGIINDPALILMDEPTVGIDPQSRNHIFDFILSLKKKGTTILYTTHYIEEADKLCDTAAIIDKGRILLSGSPKELVSRYGFSRIHFNLASGVKKEFIVKLLNIDSVVDVNISNNSMYIVSSKQNKNMEIIEQVHKISNAEKIKLMLVEIIIPNLETLFLDLTGRALRDYEDAEFINEGIKS